MMQQPFLCIDPQESQQRIPATDNNSLPSEDITAAAPTTQSTMSSAEIPVVQQQANTLDDSVEVAVVAHVKPGAWMLGSARKGTLYTPRASFIDPNAPPLGDQVVNTPPPMQQPSTSSSQKKRESSTPNMCARTTTPPPNKDFTHQPKITAKARHIANTSEVERVPVWERTIRKGEETKAKQDMLRVQQSERELDGCCFTPKTNKRPPSHLQNQHQVDPRRIVDSHRMQVGTPTRKGGLDVGSRLHASHAEKIAKHEMTRKREQLEAEVAHDFKPKITNKAKHLPHDRSVDSRTSWEMDKRLKQELAQERKRQAELAECTHAPKIDDVSAAIATLSPIPNVKRPAADSGHTNTHELSLVAAAQTPVHERLLQYGRMVETSKRDARRQEDQKLRAAANRSLNMSGDSSLIVVDANNSGTADDVFSRLHQEAQERHFDSIVREQVANTSVEGSFRPSISEGTKVIIGDGLPIPKKAVHDRLTEEGAAQKRRQLELKEEQAAHDVAQRDVSQYIGAHSVLLSTLHNAKKLHAMDRTDSPTRPRYTQRGTATPTRSGAPTRPQEKAHNINTPTPQISDTSKVLDALRMQEAYGTEAPARVKVLYDRERNREAVLERRREELKLEEEEKMAAEMARQRDLLQASQRNAAKLRTSGDGDNGSNQHRPAGSAPGSVCTPSKRTKSPSIYERQLAWRSARDQQLERKREENEGRAAASSFAECSFSPHINKPSRHGRGSPLKEALRTASPAKNMKRMIAQHSEQQDAPPSSSSHRVHHVGGTPIISPPPTSP